MEEENQTTYQRVENEIKVTKSIGNILNALFSEEFIKKDFTNPNYIVKNKINIFNTNKAVKLLQDNEDALFYSTLFHHTLKAIIKEINEYLKESAFPVQYIPIIDKDRNDITDYSIKVAKSSFDIT